MRTVQMTLDEKLVSQVDDVIRELRISRSRFTRQALQDALERYRVLKLELQHRKGYETHPVEKSEANNEFSIWETEQEWGD